MTRPHALTRATAPCGSGVTRRLAYVAGNPRGKRKQHKSYAKDTELTHWYRLGPPGQRRQAVHSTRRKKELASSKAPTLRVRPSPSARETRLPAYMSEENQIKAKTRKGNHLPNPGSITTLKKRLSPRQHSGNFIQSLTEAQSLLIIAFSLSVVKN